MFDKNKFAQILKNINETYNSQRDFSKKSEINRTYLSQYMNMKLDEPPKPKTLQKLADASKGLTNYTELMLICDYLNDDFDELMGDNITVYTCPYTINLKYNKSEKFIFDLIYSYENLNDLDYTNDEKMQITKIYNYIKNNDTYKKLILEYERIKNTVSNIDELNKKFYMCPVYGQISAGQPNWAEECIEGRLPIDPDFMGIVNPEEHFFLRVNGESMNKVVRNGAFALIHKQDYVENGEIAVVLVNGYDATLKKFTKQGDLVILEPESNDDSFKTQVYDKNTSIKILGKYIGKMEINK